MQSDNGAEWDGAFALLMEQWATKHRHITVGNSKANGQVERTIRSIKTIIRKGLSIDNTAYLSDFVPHAAIALRLSTARTHGYPPFTLVTGLIPTLPSDATSHIAIIPEGEVTAQQEKEYADSLFSVAWKLR